MIHEEPIRSRANPVFKTMGSVLAGKNRNSILLEGERLIEDALGARRAVDGVYVSLDRPELVRKFDRLDAHVFLVEPRLFRELSALENSPGIVALCKMPENRRIDTLRIGARTLVLVAHGISDPGNLGALARSAEAFGAAALVLTKGSTFPYSDKALRGSMGSLLRLPVSHGWDPAELVEHLSGLRFRHVCAATRQGRDPRVFDWTGPVALWMGAETGALPDAARRFEKLTIPIGSSVESLTSPSRRRCCSTTRCARGSPRTRIAVARKLEPASGLFGASAAPQPLAARMRPRTLEEYAGQEELLGPGKPLRRAIEQGTLGSIVLWGPPGTGKTTLARLVAAGGEREFVAFSAVSEGVPRLREIFAEARERRQATGRGTILFVDEIHRLNKSQQDSLLPAVEDGTVTLIGATTENPSFEVNGALLSRARVFVLRSLRVEEIEGLLQRALEDRERGLGALELTLAPGVLGFLAQQADGDARRALVALEAAALDAGKGGTITLDSAREALALRFAQADKSGEVHFNQLSAFHKSLRGSDPHAALYWAARLIEGGEDPMVLFRRAIAMAAEDIGLADPEALKLAVAARDAYHMLGMPEGWLPLTQMIVYLATAPKSNSVVMAMLAAREAAKATPGAGVPLDVRNAPTGLMKSLGYGAGYKYSHDSKTHYIAQEYLPDELRGKKFYEPGPFGFEKEIRKRLDWWAKQKEEGGG